MPALVDLHCHLEGTLHPSLLRVLAARNGLAVPEGLIGPDETYVWQDFTGFLAAYDRVADMIRTERDYSDVIYDHFCRVARMGQIYGEVFVSMDHAAQAGLDYVSFIDCVSDGLDRAEAEHPVTGRLILTAVRHLGAEQAVDTAQLVERYPHDRVIGFGMGGDERHGDLAEFARAFDIARDAGLGLTVHAGEVCGPSSVERALDCLKPDRIGHGVQAVQSPELMARLAGEGVTLEVCPGSNIALGLFSTYRKHAFGALRQAGCRLTLGADDPPFFGTDIAAEYNQIAEAWQLDQAALNQLTEDAIAAAFCDGETRVRLLRIAKEQARATSGNPA